MKTYIKLTLIVLATVMCTMRSAALTVTNDTLYIYDTWQQMLDKTPKKMVINPLFDVVSPHEIYIVTGNEKLDRKLIDDHLAISMGDSIWLLSTTYLKKHFTGDVKHLNGYAPVFFNGKAAYITQQGKLSLKDCLIGSAVDFEYTSHAADYYNIDFVNREVKKVTPDNLSELLNAYHDLQMRYEGMKDYKKHEIVEDYYFKYIDRLTQDVMRPNILDIIK